MVPNLGTDIERRASTCFGHAALRDNLADIEISQLEAFFFVSEDVGRFDVSVSDLMLVKVFYCLCYVQ